jgi:anti-sigma factor RsiW
MDVIEFESPRASQRTPFMADCSHCSEELARLTEENAALRRAALAFGGLAERLNLALQEERRSKQRPAGNPRDAVVEPVSRGKARLGA